MKNSYAIFVFFIVFIFVWSCKKDPEFKYPELPIHDTTPYIIDNGRFPAPRIASDNKLTKQGVVLGRMLFYEKAMSKNNAISCASCHKQEFAFTDNARFSLGVLGLEGKRQAMSVFNMAWNNNEFFWDGRAHLLRDQSLKPIQDSLEMLETLPQVILKLKLMPMYKDQFFRAFGSYDITSEKMSLAMEQFMNSIVSNKSKYDNYLAGTATLTESEESGRQLFFKEYNQFIPAESGAECAHCHSGFNFENDSYMNNGLDTESSIADIGREKVTGKITDRAKFKVTSLRNVALTAPYMHDGRFTTLEEVVDHYNSGLKASPYLDPALENTRSTGLRLTAQQKQDLVNFLKTLTDYELISNSDYSNPF